MQNPRTWPVQNLCKRSKPVHLCDMLRLEVADPYVYGQFKKGNFTVKKATHSCSAIASHHAHERNNASVKGDGGALGMTENHTALQRWMVSAWSRDSTCNWRVWSCHCTEKEDQYHRTGFDYEMLFIANCEFSDASQSKDRRKKNLQWIILHVT